MRLCKKNLDKLCKIRWKDAKGGIRQSLVEFIKDGFAVNVTVGWLKHYDKEKIVIASEYTEKDFDTFDLCMIPRGWIKDLTFLEKLPKK